DLDIDILASGSEKAGWFENLRHGGLRWRSFQGDLAELSGSASLSIAELDGNLSWDPIGTGSGKLHIVRTTTDPGVSVTAIDSMTRSDGPFEKSLVEDLDNDGHPDLISWSEAAVRVFRGTPPSRFRPVETAIASP